MFSHCLTILVKFWAPVLKLCSRFKNLKLWKFTSFSFLHKNCCISFNFFQFLGILCKIHIFPIDLGHIILLSIPHAFKIIPFLSHFQFYDNFCTVTVLLCACVRWKFLMCKIKLTLWPYRVEKIIAEWSMRHKKIALVLFFHRVYENFLNA